MATKGTPNLTCLNFSAASLVIEKKQRTNDGRGKEKGRGNETGVTWSVPIFFPESSYTVSEDYCNKSINKYIEFKDCHTVSE